MTQTHLHFIGMVSSWRLDGAALVVYLVENAVSCNLLQNKPRFLSWVCKLNAASHGYRRYFLGRGVRLSIERQ